MDTDFKNSESRVTLGTIAALELSMRHDGTGDAPAVSVDNGRDGSDDDGHSDDDDDGGHDNNGGSHVVDVDDDGGHDDVDDGAGEHAIVAFSHGAESSKGTRDTQESTQDAPRYVCEETGRNN